MVTTQTGRVANINLKAAMADEKANSFELGCSSTTQGRTGGKTIMATGSQGGGGGLHQHPSMTLRAIQASQVRASQPITVQHGVRIIGSGCQWVIFLHAFGDNQQAWMPIVNELDHSKHRIVLYDQTGALGSDYDLFNEDRYGTLHGHADDLLAIINELREQQKNPDLQFAFVGHGQAGMIGLLASLKRPAAFTRLVLMSSSPRLLDDTGYEGGFTLEDVSKALGFMESNAELWNRNCTLVFNVDDFREERLHALTRRLFLLRPDVAFCLLRSTFALDLRDVLPQVVVPVHIITAARDATKPLSVAHYMAEHLKNCIVMELDCEDVFKHVPSAVHCIEKCL